MPKLGSNSSDPGSSSTTSGTETVKPPTPSPQPLDPLIPDPIAAQSKDKDGNTIYDKNERVSSSLKHKVKQFLQNIHHLSSHKESLEDSGIGEDGTKKNIRRN